MINENRKQLDSLLERFRFWMHIDDPTTIYTLAAAKISHKLPGDPVWLMIIGASSDGKSETLRAFTNPRTEITCDDLTSNTFVSGYKSKSTDEIPQFAEQLNGKIWYIYDLSILMSKTYEERSMIFSDLRMIYDGQLEKRYGNKQHFQIDTRNNTLICGTTPVIDRTILEDQIMGTRFMTWRMKTGNRMQIMAKIDEVEENIVAMRGSLNVKCQDWYNETQVDTYVMNETENQNLRIMAEKTTLMRTSVDLDKNKELSNIAYPEAPGRFYRQLKKMYMCYRIIGLTEDEALHCCRKLCIDCIIPTRIKILEWLYNNNKNNAKHTLSEISVGMQMGKGACKSHLSALLGLGVVRFEERYNESWRRVEEQWEVLDGNWGILFEKPTLKQETIKESPWEKVEETEGICAGCGFNYVRSWKLEGDYYCEQCRKSMSDF